MPDFSPVINITPAYIYSICSCAVTGFCVFESGFSGSQMDPLVAYFKKGSLLCNLNSWLVTQILLK